jgi:hypothetical protein
MPVCLYATPLAALTPIAQTLVRHATLAGLGQLLPVTVDQVLLVTVPWIWNSRRLWPGGSGLVKQGRNKFQTFLLSLSFSACWRPNRLQVNRPGATRCQMAKGSYSEDQREPSRVATIIPRTLYRPSSKLHHRLMFSNGYSHEAHESSAQSGLPSRHLEPALGPNPSVLYFEADPTQGTPGTQGTPVEI